MPWVSVHPAASLMAPPSGRRAETERYFPGSGRSPCLEGEKHAPQGVPGPALFCDGGRPVAGAGDPARQLGPIPAQPFRSMTVRSRGGSARIVLGTEFLSSDLQAGGHWTWFLQYPLGLRALGHDVFVLEVLRSTGERSTDEGLVGRFFRRLGQYGLREHAAVLVHAAGDHVPPALDSGVLYGAD